MERNTPQRSKSLYEQDKYESRRNSYNQKKVVFADDFDMDKSEDTNEYYVPETHKQLYVDEFDYRNDLYKVEEVDLPQLPKEEKKKPSFWKSLFKGKNPNNHVQKYPL